MALFDRRIGTGSRSVGDRPLAAGIFFVALAVYLLTYSGGFKSNDERALFAGTDSFVKRGTFTINQIYWDYTHVGMLTRSGEMVPNYEPAQMVLAIPWYLWGRALDAAAQGAMFFGAVIAAAAVALLYLCLLELGFARRTAVLTAFVFAFATQLWPYSRTFFREPLTTLACLLAFYALLPSRPPAPRRLIWPALTGLALGIAIANKQTSIAVVPGLLLLAVASEWQRPFGTWRDRLSAALAALVPLALVLGLYRLYYLATLSDVTAFARDVGEFATNPQLSTSRLGQMAYAFLGLTVSPYKGMFWYSPVLLLGIAGAWPFLRRHFWEGLACLLIIAAYVLGYSRYLYWSGGVAWGPRYMLVLVPFFMLLAAPVFAWLLGDSSDSSEHQPSPKDPILPAPPTTTSSVPASPHLRVSPSPRLPVFYHNLARLLVLLLVLLSFAVQLLGVALDWRTYELRFLLDQAKVWGGIGEAIQALYMVPAYSPVLGHLRLLLAGGQPLDFAWIPLRPQGTWGFLPLGLALALLGVAGAVAGLVWLWHRPRRPGAVVALLSVFFVVLSSALLLVYRRGDARYDPYNVDRFLRPMDGILGQAAATGQLSCCRTGTVSATGCSSVLIVPDPVLTEYFLNYLRAPLPWYDVDPRPAPAALLDQLAGRYRDIWLARDRSAAADDQEGRRDVERYLAEHAYKVGEQQVGGWARLIRFSAAGELAETVGPAGTLGDMALDGATLRVAGLDVPAGCGTPDEPLAQHTGDGLVRARKGDMLQVGLNWRAVSRPPADYTVFVQLLDAESQVKVQSDRWPGDGLFPTTALAAGGTIADNLALPLDVPPGQYRLIAGLYRSDLPGQPRLSGPDGDFVSLADVEVTAGS